MSVTVPRSRAAVCAVRAVVAVGESGVVVGCWAWALTAPKSSSGKQAAEQEMAFMCENVLGGIRAQVLCHAARRDFIYGKDTEPPPFLRPRARLIGLCPPQNTHLW